MVAIYFEASGVFIACKDSKLSQRSQLEICIKETQGIKLETKKLKKIILTGGGSGVLQKEWGMGTV